MSTALISRLYMLSTQEFKTRNSPHPTLRGCLSFDATSVPFSLTWREEEFICGVSHPSNSIYGNKEDRDGEQRVQRLYIRLNVKECFPHPLAITPDITAALTTL